MLRRTSTTEKISAFQRFFKDEYICYEGQPGDDMYIILEGLVGIYLTNTIGRLTEISRIGSGDFFGEMAIFDHLPRSASCIALEETICISINRDNLKQLLENCPEIVEKMLVNMSLRIRNLNDQIHNHKAAALMKRSSTAKFSIPAEYTSHWLDQPYQDPRCFLQYKA